MDKEIDALIQQWQPQNSSPTAAITVTPTEPPISDGPVATPAPTDADTAEINQLMQQWQTTQKVQDTILPGGSARGADTVLPAYPEFETANPEIKSYHNLMRQVWNRTADVGAYPPELVNEIFTMAGLGLFPKGAAKNFIIEEMLKPMGIRADPIDHVSKYYGDATFNALAESIAFMLAAPYMAASKGVSAGSAIVKHIGEQIQKHPFLVSASNIAAGLGAEAGKQATEGFLQDPTVKSLVQPFAQVMGGFAGSMGFTPVAKLTGWAADGTKRVAEWGMRFGEVKRLQSELTAVQRDIDFLRTTPGREREVSDLVLKQRQLQKDLSKNQALFNKSDFATKIDMFKTYSEEMIKADLDKGMRGVADAVNLVRNPGRSAADLQTAVRERLSAADTTFRRIEKEYWQRVDQDIKVPTINMMNDLNAMRSDIGVRLSDLPYIPGSEKIPGEKAHDFIEVLEKLITREVGKRAYALPSIEELRHQYGRIGRALRTEASARDHTPNDAKIRSYSRLLNIIDNAIHEARPMDPTLQAARNFSKKYHELFDRGGIADITSMRARGDPRVDPEQTVEKLMTKYKGLQELIDIRNTGVYVRQPGAAHGFAVTKAERENLQMLVKESEDSIRALYRETADQMHPDDAMKAARWFERNEHKIKPMARVHAELEQSVTQVHRAIEHKRSLEKSALHKWTQVTPDKLVENIWGNGNPRARSEEVWRAFSHDPDAVKGYKAAMIQQFFKRSGGDAVTAKAILDTPRFKSLLQHALSEDGGAEFERLSRIVNRAHQVAISSPSHLPTAIAAGTVGTIATAGFDSAFAGAIGTSAIVGARLGGAAVGRWMGTGTIQAPGIISNRLGAVVQRILKASDPDAMLTYAVVDPRWERILAQKIPMDAREGRKAVNKVRRLMAGIVGGTEVAADMLSDDDGGP